MTRIPLTVGTLFILTVLAVVAVALAGWLVTTAWPSAPSGAATVVVSALVASAASLLVYTRLLAKSRLGRQDVTAWLVVTALTLLVGLVVQDVLPTVFAPSATALQSMFGLP